MSESYQTAVTLLMVGMITVFSILALVVFLGQALIRMVNQFFPSETAEQVRNLTSQQTTNETLNAKKTAAISAAVHHFTRGKGIITSIEKID